MSETSNNTPRLLAAAKEFNIGKDTLIEYLSNKGYDMGEFSSPNARLNAQMYAALQSEFQQDKNNKKKSDQIALPKGSVLETAKKKEKEEAEVPAKKPVTAAPAAPKETPAPVQELPKQPVKPEPVVKPEAEKAPQAPASTPAPAANTTPAPETKPAPEVKPAEPVAAAPKEQPAPPKAPEAPAAPAPEVVKTESPKINGPKVIATIDLDALNPANRAKKPAADKAPNPVPAAPAKESTPAPAPAPQEAKATDTTPKETIKPAAAAPEAPAAIVKPEAPKQEQTEQTKPAPVQATTEAHPTVEKQEKPAARESQTVVVTANTTTPPQEAPAANTSNNINTTTPPPPAAENEGPALVENIQADRLTGPKVIGKINLPVESDRRDNNKNNRDDKRKRKRIIVEKKPEPIQSREFGDQQNRNQGQGGQHGQHGQHGQQGHGGQQGNRPPFNRDNRGGHQGQGGGQQGNRPPFNRDQQGQGGQQGNRPPYNRDQQGQGGNRTNTGGPGGNRGGNQQGGGYRGGNNQQGGNRNFGNNRPHTPYNRGGNTGNTGAAGAPDREIDKNEIQNKIKETMAKLGGGARGGRSQKSKHRREKRQEMADQQANGDQNNKLQVTEFISVSELANLMDVSFAEVISKCMSLGIMVSINQRIDAEVIELVAGEFGFEVEFIGMDDAEEMDEEDVQDAPEDLLPRAPIVTIMGHVDHGKTSLLDYIRNTKVTAGEAGGITQHIGAYEVTVDDGRQICFLDTPGHEAFTAMRARGAKGADIAVIVIAADDAIMPQTREAISHAQAANVPMIFAINKVDKDGANPEKIKEQLAGMNLLVEDWGGKYQSQEISAKTGLNIDQLLEKILLEAELLELKANPNREASGSIIEASLDKGRGYVSTILVQNGTLKQGDTIVSGAYYGKIKAMTNEKGLRRNTAGPSTPVQVLGLNGAPQAGEKFRVYADEAEAKEVANRRSQLEREQVIRTKKHITLDEIGRRLALGNFKQLNLIIKGDFDGSVEALSDSLQKLSTEEIVVSIVHKAVGQITESDVLLATASDAVILGFQVRPSSQAARLAEKENIEIRNYSIIYDAIEEIKSAMEGMLEPKIERKVVAHVEVRETYRFDKVTVAGCFVLDGKISRNTRITVVRDGIVVHTGELGSLKRYKDDVKEVVSNMECGLSIRNYSDIQVGDIVEGFEEVEVKRTL